MAQLSNDPASEGLVIEGVPAGEYRVTTQLPGGGYVSAIRCGEKDLLESTLVIGGGAAVPAIEVTLRNDGAEIDGSIVGMGARDGGSPTMPTGSGLAAVGYVYIVPARGGGEVKSLVSQPNGEFAIQQLAPGTYRVLAFDRQRNDLEFSDEEAMRKFGGAGGDGVGGAEGEGESFVEFRVRIDGGSCLLDGESEKAWSNESHDRNWLLGMGKTAPFSKAGGCGTQGQFCSSCWVCWVVRFGGAVAAGCADWQGIGWRGLW